MSTIDQTLPARRAGSADRVDVNRTLTEAFLDDPVFAWIFPDPANRAEVLAPTFDAFADAFARHDETHLLEPTGVVTAVAMWAPPGVAPVHPDDEERFGLRVAELAGPCAERMAECGERFGAVHPHEPAWYLQFLGVAAAHQGHGHGSTLLREVLAGADAAGEAAYLEATTQRNRALYERHGFRCIGDIELPDGPTSYAMWRDPR